MYIFKQLNDEIFAKPVNSINATGYQNNSARKAAYYAVEIFMINRKFCVRLRISFSMHSCKAGVFRDSFNVSERRYFLQKLYLYAVGSCFSCVKKNVYKKVSEFADKLLTKLNIRYIFHSVVDKCCSGY